jgi:hypothetical protein
MEPVDKIGAILKKLLRGLFRAKVATIQQEEIDRTIAVINAVPAQEAWNLAGPDSILTPAIEQANRRLIQAAEDVRVGFRNKLPEEIPEAQLALSTAIRQAIVEPWLVKRESGKPSGWSKRLEGASVGGTVVGLAGVAWKLFRLYNGG